MTTYTAAAPRYSFPGFDDEPRTAESALQEFIDTYEAPDEETTELLFSMTNCTAPAADNIAAIIAAADYYGIELTATGYPAPTLMPPAHEPTDETVAAALQAALVCLLWTGRTDRDESDPTDEPTDENLDDYETTDLPLDGISSVRDELVSFLTDNAADIMAAHIEPAQIGHDFILTRNGHGAGFWDRGYADSIGTRLTDACKPYGTLNASAYRGTLYLEG